MWADLGRLPVRKYTWPAHSHDHHAAMTLLRPGAVAMVARNITAPHVMCGVATPTPRRAERSLPLAALMRDIRQEVGGLPLTLLVHGWGNPQVQAFLAVLSGSLRSKDALWLIAAGVD